MLTDFQYKVLKRLRQLKAQEARSNFTLAELDNLDTSLYKLTIALLALEDIGHVRLTTTVGNSHGNKGVVEIHEIVLRGD